MGASLLDSAHPTQSLTVPFRIVPPGIDAVVADLSARRCCLLVGPSGSGTTTALRLIRDRYLKKLPDAGWWYIDLKELPHDSTRSLLISLAASGAGRYPIYRDVWQHVINESDLCGVLFDSALHTGQPLILAIDHIEHIPRECAQFIVRGVRSLHQNGQGERVPRIITVILAGSHRLYRQAADYGSPLNFAVVHELKDSSPAEVQAAFDRLPPDLNWHFTPDAVAYLAQETGGDRFLLRRFVDDCVGRAEARSGQISLEAPISIDEDLAAEAVDSYVCKGFKQDASQQTVLPELIRDEEALQQILVLLQGKPVAAPAGALINQRNLSASVMRLLRFRRSEAVIRSPIYERILRSYRGILQAAQDNLRRHGETVARQSQLYGLSVRAHLAVDDADGLKAFLQGIAALTGTASASLLSFDAHGNGYRLVGSHLADGAPVGIAQAQSLIKFPALMHPDPVTCDPDQARCLGVCPLPEEHRCTWFPVNLRDGRPIAALVLQIRDWIPNHRTQQELHDALQILAYAMEARRQREGLDALSRIDAGGSARQEMLSATSRAIGLIFNAAEVMIWERHAMDTRCQLQFPVSADPKWHSIDWRKCKKALTKRRKNGISVITSKNAPFSLEPFRTILVILFAHGERRTIVGVASKMQWKPDSDHWMLGRLARKDIIALYEREAQILETKRLQQANARAAWLLSHELKLMPGKIQSGIQTLLKRQEQLMLSMERNEQMDFAEFLDYLREKLARTDGFVEKHRELIDRLVFLSELDAGRISLSSEPEPLLTSIESAIEDLRQELEENEIEVDIRVDQGFEPCARLDKMLFERAVKNLLRNTIQYAGKGQLTIVLKPDDRGTRISFADQGPGVPEEYHETIFERFDRGQFESRTGSYGNLGIGLYIVNRVMELHGGKAEYDGKHENGACFLLFFPSPEENADEIQDSDGG